MPTPLADRLAVCSWSLKPTSPADLVAKMKRTGIDKLQLALDPIREDDVWQDAHRQLEQAGLKVIGGMMRCVGEDYTTLETIRRTGGLVPDATWPDTWDHVQEMAPIAADLGLSYAMFHAGFLPHDPAYPSFHLVRQRVARVADLFQKHGVRLGLETGQEDARTLLRFLQHLNHPNVGINFDPANMILYDKGDPVESLRLLAPRVIQCHVKDAVRTAVPGEWGREVVVGTGQVDWRGFLRVLDEAGFDGYLSIEREFGDRVVEDIKDAKSYLANVECLSPND